jgi:prepilin-type N-terminal cleavage/methylation domain-containing protein
MRRPRDRAGFTLIEMVIVMIIIAIVADVTIPAMLRLGVQQTTSADELHALLQNARSAALTRGMPVRVVIDAQTGEYRADTLGSGGTGPIAAGTLDVMSGVSFVTDSLSSRIRFTFLPSGVAFGDSVMVQGLDGLMKVTVDPLTGVFRGERR